jgi:hypothetical protein
LIGTVGQLPILEEPIGQFEIADAVNPKVESGPGFAGVSIVGLQRRAGVLEADFVHPKQILQHWSPD